MRIIIAILLAFVSLCTNAAEADIALSCNVNNYWSSWENGYAGIYGKYSGFSISYSGDQNWDWFFRFQIIDYIVPSKERMKWYKKNDMWIEYHGTVEYYVTDRYPTIEDVMRSSGVCLLPAKGEDHRIKRTAKATIRIAPYKKFPKVYNIFFDGVGYAIDLKRTKWDRNQ